MSIRRPVRLLPIEDLADAYPLELLANFATGDLTLVDKDGSTVVHKKPGTLTVKQGSSTLLATTDLSGNITLNLPESQDVTDISGNAATATKMATDRTFTIGNASAKSFNNLTSLSWTLADIGAAAVGHNHDDAYSAIDHNHDTVYSKLGHTHNGFTKFVVGGTTLEADAADDSLTITAGSNITLTPNATGDSFTIAATDTTYSQATSSTLGLVKIGYTETGKNYPVELNGVGQMFVNVPWTDNNTTYEQASSATLGLVKIGYSTSGKNYGVQLDDSGKMFVNVPWTDNNTTYTLSKSGNTITLSDGEGNEISSITDSNTTYSKATSSALGLVKIGYAESGQNYPVELNADGQMFVNVPWTDANDNTTYTLSKSGNTITLADGEGNVVSTITDSNTTYSQATSDALGLVKIGYDASGKNYAVQLDSNGKMFVNVPWTDNNTNTTYTLSNSGATVTLTPSSGDAQTITIPTVSSSALGLARTGYTTSGKNYAVKAEADGDLYVNVPWENTTYSQATSSTLGLVKIGYTESGKNYPVELDSDGKMYVNVPWTDTNDNTTYSKATDSTLGLVKIGYATSGKNYAVQLDSDGKMFVNVPWTDNNTTYSQATSSALGLVKLYTATGSATDGTMTQDAITSALNGKANSTHDHTSITGTAAKATILANSRNFSITGGATAAAVGFTGAGDVALNITSLDGSKITGVIPLASIPQGAQERFIPVADAAARLALTTDDAQSGDVVQEQDTGLMFYIKDDSKLGTEDAFAAFTAGTASAVSWTNVTGRPTFVQGSNVTITTDSSNNVTIAAKDTTYNTATSSTLGLVKIGYTENGKNYPVELSDGKMFVNVPWTDNNTTYSQATSSALGLVKIGYTESGKNYPVELDSDGKMFVNVPWTDTNDNTTYSQATSSTLGLVKIGYSASGKNYAVQLDSDGKMYVNVPWTDNNDNTTYTLSNSGATITLTPSSGDAQTVTIPTISSTALGLAKTGYTTSDKNYAVKSDTSGNLYVNVPWTDNNDNTTYSAGTGLSLSGTTFNHSNSVTAGTAQGDASKTLTWGGTFTIPTLTYDAQGHVTGKGTTTMTMPDNPNTDTHYTATLISGASATASANAAASNGSVYLNLIENGTVRNSHNIVGSGATTVASDANGKITISSTNTTYSAGTGISLSGTTINHSNSVTAGTAQGSATGTLTWGGTFTIPTITYDAQGHVTGKGTTTLTMPANPDTDTHHTAYLYTGKTATDTANATATNGNVYLNLVENGSVRSSHKIVGSGATTVTTDANGVITISSTDNNDNTTYSAGTGLSLSGTTFNHSNSVTAGTAQGDASKTLTWGGTFTIPTVTYDAQGHVTGKGTTTMTMPANPDTDTHHTAYLYTGASNTAKANAAATNGNVYLNLVENGTVRNSHNIVGSGATTVTCDANGKITISSTNTTYSDATTSAAGLMTAAMVTKLNGIATGANAYTLPTASTTLGGVKTTSTVTSTSGLTACPIISGVVYYKDTNTTYSLSSFGVTATAAELNALDGITATVTELNYCDGVTSNIQTQLNAKAANSHTHSYLALSGGTLTGTLTSRAITVQSGYKLTITTAGNVSGVAVQYTATVGTSWTGSAAPYSQTITVSGITASDVPIVDFTPSGTYATDQAYEEAFVNFYRITTAANSITVYSHEKTTTSVPIRLRCIR